MRQGSCNVTQSRQNFLLSTANDTRSIVLHHSFGCKEVFFFPYTFISPRLINLVGLQSITFHPGNTELYMALKKGEMKRWLKKEYIWSSEERNEEEFNTKISPGKIQQRKKKQRRVFHQTKQGCFEFWQAFFIFILTISAGFQVMKLSISLFLKLYIFITFFLTPSLYLDQSM